MTDPLSHRLREQSNEKLRMMINPSVGACRKVNSYRTKVTLVRRSESRLSPLTQDAAGDGACIAITSCGRSNTKPDEIGAADVANVMKSDASNSVEESDLHPRMSDVVPCAASVTGLTSVPLSGNDSFNGSSPMMPLSVSGEAASIAEEGNILIHVRKLTSSDTESDAINDDKDVEEPLEGAIGIWRPYDFGENSPLEENDAVEMNESVCTEAGEVEVETVKVKVKMSEKESWTDSGERVSEMGASESCQYILDHVERVPPAPTPSFSPSSHFTAGSPVAETTALVMTSFAPSSVISEEEEEEGASSRNGKNSVPESLSRVDIPAHNDLSPIWTTIPFAAKDDATHRAVSATTINSPGSCECASLTVPIQIMRVTQSSKESIDFSPHDVPRSSMILPKAAPLLKESGKYNTPFIETSSGPLWQEGSNMRTRTSSILPPHTMRTVEGSRSAPSVSETPPVPPARHSTRRTRDLHHFVRPPPSRFSPSSATTIHYTPTPMKSDVKQSTKPAFGEEATEPFLTIPRQKKHDSFSSRLARPLFIKRTSSCSTPMTHTQSNPSTSACNEKGADGRDEEDNDEDREREEEEDELQLFDSEEETDEEWGRYTSHSSGARQSTVAARLLFSNHHEKHDMKSRGHALRSPKLLRSSGWGVMKTNSKRSTHPTLKRYRPRLTSTLYWLNEPDVNAIYRMVHSHPRKEVKSVLSPADSLQDRDRLRRGLRQDKSTPPFNSSPDSNLDETERNNQYLQSRETPLIAHPFFYALHQSAQIPRFSDKQPKNDNDEMTTKEKYGNAKLTNMLYYYLYKRHGPEGRSK